MVCFKNHDKLVIIRVDSLAFSLALPGTIGYLTAKTWPILSPSVRFLIDTLSITSSGLYLAKGPYKDCLQLLHVLLHLNAHDQMCDSFGRIAKPR